MKYTSNYNLKKPEGSDTVNIDDLNDNFDVIDQALKNHEDDLATKETPAGAQAKAEAALNSAKQYTDQEVGEVAQELVAHKAENATLNQLGHVNHAVLTATLNTSWSGSSAPYTKTISVSGILPTDVPFIDIVMSGTYATDTARQEAWGYIYRAVTANGSITFYATEKPTVSLPIQIKVVR